MSHLDDVPALLFRLDGQGVTWHNGTLPDTWHEVLGLPASAPATVARLRPGEEASWHTNGPRPMVVRVLAHAAGATGVAVPLQQRPSSDWLNAAAHELATPLTPIRLLLRTLRASDLSPKAQHAVDALDRNVRRLQSVVSDLVEAERLEHAPLTVKPVVAPVDGWVSNAVRRLGPDVRPGRRCGAIAAFDPEHAHRVLERLVQRLRAQAHEAIEVGAECEGGRLRFIVEGDRANADVDGDLGLRLAARLVSAQDGRLYANARGYEVCLPGEPRIQGATA